MIDGYYGHSPTISRRDGYPFNLMSLDWMRLGCHDEELVEELRSIGPGETGTRLPISAWTAKFGGPEGMSLSGSFLELGFCWNFGCSIFCLEPEIKEKRGGGLREPSCTEKSDSLRGAFPVHLAVTHVVVDLTFCCHFSAFQ
jgi:hypothetical protein